MPEPFQSTTGLIFVANFLLALFLHDYLAGIAIFAVTYFAVFFISDFSFTPPDVGIYYHVWSIGLALVSSLAGFYYALVFKTDPMISIQTAGKRYYKFTLGTFAIQLHILFVVLLAFGINSWADRPDVGGGVYPFGVDLVTAGIATTIAAIVGLVVTTIILATRSAEKDPYMKHTAKYVWIVPLVPATIVINDIGNYVWWYQLLMFVAFAVAWVLVWVMSVYIPTGKAKDEDQFYQHKTYALYVFGIAALITLLGLILLWIVVVWAEPTSSLETGMIVMISYAGVILLAAFIASFTIHSNTIAEIKDNSRPVAVERRDNGIYAVLNRNGQTNSIPLSRYST